MKDTFAKLINSAIDDPNTQAWILNLISSVSLLVLAIAVLAFVMLLRNPK